MPHVAVPRGRRIGLVLGAGGILGPAWMTGALTALGEHLDRPLGELDLVVGTSAGSVLAAALRCGGVGARARRQPPRPGLIP